MSKVKAIVFLLLCVGFTFVLSCSRLQTAEPVDTRATPVDTVAAEATVPDSAVMETRATDKGYTPPETEPADSATVETSATPRGTTTPAGQ